MRAFLYVAGAAMELGGIVLVGSPDLVPQARRLSNWLRIRARGIADWVLRVLRRPRHRVASVGAAGSVAFAGSASAFKSVNPKASLEEKVMFLLSRDEEAQRDMNVIQLQLSEFRQQVTATIETERTDMKDHVADALTTAHAAYLPLRITGAFALALGLGLATAANFVD